ncbi:MAG: chemotaxis protein CheX [bacterium]|nr:chemotaxis protein CheX [bacterium]
MDVKYINPFINAVVTTFETMIGLSIDRLDPFIKTHATAQGDISGIIGYASKDIIGSVALTFPEGTALEIYRLMMGEVVNDINEEVKDTVGELANIVAGTAKNEFSNLEISYHISIPTVVVGKNHTISHKGSVPVVVIPFQMTNFKFFMEISMKLNSVTSVSQRMRAKMQTA